MEKDIIAAKTKEDTTTQRSAPEKGNYRSCIYQRDRELSGWSEQVPKQKLLCYDNGFAEVSRDFLQLKITS